MAVRTTLSSIGAIRNGCARSSTSGWPSASVVGGDVAHLAWLLVQHADHDVAFQERCLALMRALPPGEVAPADIAHLEDRTAVRRGRPQRYGTQFRTSPTGEVEPHPIEDPGALDARRAAVGLGTFAEYRGIVLKRQKP